MCAAIILICGFFAPAVAVADSINLSSVEGQTLYLTVLPYPGENDGHFYIGPTGGWLSTTPDYLATSIGWLLQIICHDSQDEINGLPQTVEVTVENLGGPSIPNNMGMTADEIREQAYIAAFFFGLSPSEDITAQHAIWDLSGGINGVMYTSSDVTSLLAIAAISSKNTNYPYANAYTFRPVDPTIQTFMYAPPPPVPEASSLVLFGTGLFVLAGIVYQRQRLHKQIRNS